MRQSIVAVAVLTLTSLLVSGVWSIDGRRSLMAGLADPLLGLDHFMVLVGIGLWAGKLGNSASRRLPTVFLVGALAGFVLAAGQPPGPLLETLVRGLVIGSMLLVAAALAIPLNLPPRKATSTVAMIGGCHGYLHWSEVGSAEVIWFGFGSFVTAAALMAMGVAVARHITQAD